MARAAAAPGSRVTARAKRASGPLRILLVKTSAPGAAFLPAKAPCVTVPLGILYVAAALRKSLGERVRVEVDSLSTAVRSIGDLPRFIASRSPDVLGVSSTLVEARLARDICSAARDAMPSRPPFIMIGGPYPTCSPSEALASTGADIAVMGEGDATAVGIVEALLDGRSPRGIAGTAHAVAGSSEAAIAPRAEPITDLDSLELPAWDLVDIGAYSPLFNMNDMPARREPYCTIMTSRGCPYRCSFCHNIFGKRFRARSPGSVVGEIELLHDRFGVRELHIVDDIFNFDGHRMEAICEAIVSRGLDVALAFPNAVRGDILTRRQIRLLGRAGCYSITLALESASPRIQKLMGKRLNIDKLHASAAAASAEGMITSCFAMVGYPTETPEEMRTTIEWLRASPFDFPRVCMATPFPDTAMARHAEQAGLVQGCIDADCAHYDASNIGAQSAERAALMERFRQGIKEIYEDPARRRRLESIWARWPREKWLPYGFGRS